MIIINYIYLINTLIPLRLREEHLLGFLNVCITPVITLHDVFQAFFQRKKWELTWNGQVCMLEELLNQEFNPSELLPKIYITDGGLLEGTYIFGANETIAPTEEAYVWNNDSDNNPETNPLYNELWLYNSNEFEENFIIHIPLGLVFSLEKFTALVDKYKLPTTKYKIVYE